MFECRVQAPVLLAGSSPEVRDVTMEVVAADPGVPCISVPGMVAPDWTAWVVLS